MKVRLRHGSVAKQEKPSHATGYGLPPTILNKVLRAPDLPRPGTLTLWHNTMMINILHKYIFH